MKIEDKLFNQLLQRHLEGIITVEEEKELMRLIAKGKSDSFLEEHIHQSLKNTTGDEKDLSKIQADKLLKNILADRTGISRTIKIRKSKLLSKLAIAATILCVLGGFWWIYTASLPEKMLNHSNVISQIASPQASFISLPDGSTVILTTGSKLSYPTEFEGQNREVTLIGEGYFDIKSDPAHPFIIQSRNVTTKVLGTAFNIRAYPEEEDVIITVDHGKVEVTDQDETVTLVKNKQAIINTGNKPIEEKTVNAEEVLAWQKQIIVLDDISMAQAMKKLSEHYKINFLFANENIKKCSIRAAFFNGESIDEVMAVISSVLSIEWEYKSKHSILIKGKGCP